MTKRVVVLICVLGLLTSACGGRAKSTGSDSTAFGATTTTAAGNAADMIGPLPIPWGPGTPKAAPAGTVGVTDNSIKIAVISDKAGQVKIPTASIEESMRAFAGWCNDLGGIEGRKLVL